MYTSSLFLLVVSFIIIIFIWNLPFLAYGQSQIKANTSTLGPEDGTGKVSSSASVTVGVSNESLKTKEGMLRSSIVGLLGSGPNILKSPDMKEPLVKAKITNQINNDTQNVEGIEATNAIIGVEVSKALRTLIAMSEKPNQTAIVTIQTSSTCKPSDTYLIACENTVVIK